MKKYIFYMAALVSIATVSCRKIETDGEPIIITVPGGGGGTPTGQTIFLKGRISADTLLKKENIYILQGLVYMVGNHTMTIQPGTTIKGSYGGTDVAALIITRGSKLVAAGTSDNPIIFTSSSPNPQSGDWGGVVLCGKAPINSSFQSKPGLYQVEGGIDNSFGDGLAGSGDAVVPTAVPTDSSGVLQYIRIEYAGYAFQPDKEINSLTMAGVGSKTVIDHIQTIYAKDDAFEWFGGTVNCKYLIAYRTLDDDFDTDLGYNGKVQFGLIIRDSVLADGSRSEAFESDNDANGTTATPKTTAIFSNITAIGPRATTANVGNSLFRGAAHIRRNTAISIFNSIIMGWPVGIEVDAVLGSSTALNIEDSTLRLRNITISGTVQNTKFSGTAGVTITSDAAFTTWFTNPFYNNDFLVNNTDVKLVNPYSYTAPDPTPFAAGNGNAKVLGIITTSPLTYRSDLFSDPKFNGDTFFDKTDPGSVAPGQPLSFRGGIAPSGPLSSWWKGWTKFNFN